MSSIFNFKLNPLSLALKANAVSLVVLMSSVAEARVVTGPNETVRPGPAPDSFELRAGSGLTVEGATTKQIRAQSATLTINPGSKTQDITAFNSNVDINGAQITARATQPAALLMSGGALSLKNSTLTHSNGTGLVVSRPIGSDEGAIAAVFNSSITGTTRGVSVGGNSALALYQSDVAGTGENGVGLYLFGQAIAIDSSITGALNGVRMDMDRSPEVPAALILDGSYVEGKTGAAILVESSKAGTPANASIDVRNGSILRGGNGNILEVTGGSFANMNVDSSELFGDVVVEEGSTAKLQLNNGSWLTGQLKNVAELSVNNASHWVLVGDSEVGDLKMAGGSVHFGGADEFYQLDVDSLSGDGTFVMHTDFASGQTDLLNVNGVAEGNHSLLLEATGSELVTAEPIRVVHTEGGDAKFALVGETVDVGAYSYGLKQEDTDWYLDPNRRGTSNSTKAVMALFNTSPTVLYGEMTLLRTRMGELRFSQGNNEGFWMRGYGNKYEVSGNQDGGGYTQNQRGFTLGIDTPLYGGDGQWVAGVMAGHSTSDIDLDRSGSGQVDSYYVGGYATWLDDESGLYFDGVVKLNRLHNEVNVSMSDGKRAKGNYTQNAVGASVEVGRHITLDDDFFVEPYGQLSATITQAQSYDLDNGLHAKGDRSASVVGKAGVTVGKSIQLDSGGVLQPYLRTALAHEFNHNNKVTVNGETFNNDVFGSRIEMAGGVAMSVSRNVKLHADVEHTRGKTVDQPWGVNFGVRYDF
ncbi:MULTISPECIES: autotransporter outer membrane beta-barrel domain-containing protein [Pseudomonas]|uniref:Autotransporter outer membrane beta-barrel domain-containing protein n=2 Tax=Pseudomonas TaxID=286 RepID=A0ABZ2DQJ2_9PSED|nr:MULTISPECIES: autotransporter outer membrane beta-barrel domain-containing protein [Pseudomonas fluorescens group]AZE60936.1 autotransporter [Pseudomonas synxantha]KIR20095.1 putative autotransporter precursor [Pseudomonas fluorescens]